jgi:hypothetical protein
MIRVQHPRMIRHVAFYYALSASAVAADSGKRPLPDYDGLGTRPVTASQVLLWVPRLVVSPLYLTQEFLLRRPIGALVVVAEKHRIPQTMIEFFTLDKDHKVGLFPTALLDFGFKPSVGFYFFWDEFLAEKNKLRVRAGTWGPRWISVAVTDRYALDPSTDVGVHAAFSRRYDGIFAGLGPSSRAQDLSRYEADTFDGGLDFEKRDAHALRLTLGLGLRTSSFDHGTCCGDPSLRDAVRDGRLALPPGFNDGYSVVYQQLRASYDSRAKRPAAQSGIRIEGEVAPSFDVRRAPGSAWLRYGASAEGFVDVTGTQRVLSLACSALLTDKLQGPDDIPFTEQITLGGPTLMRGFLPGRLIGRTAVVATLKYSWPLWTWLDGTLQTSLGNVFGQRFTDFEPKLLRISTAVGIKSSNSPENQLELLAGFGSETLAEGAAIRSIRLAVGGTHGF